MNASRYFVDTNVLLYAHDFSEVGKRDRARTWIAWLWSNTAAAISWQVLQEFYWNAVGKLHVPHELARTAVSDLAQWNPPDVTLGLIERAWYWTDLARITFWDGLIVAAAERTRCRFLLSEDFQTGCEFGSITVLNPFETNPPGTTELAILRG